MAKSSSDYIAYNHNNTEFKQDRCYLCNEILEGDITPDHIIPDSLFSAFDPHRPKLSVHSKCNNDKSKNDEWFVRHLQLRSSFNEGAYREFSSLLDKAVKEISDAYLIGRKVRNYKLTKTIFDKAVWGLELHHQGKEYMQLKIPPNDVIRFRQYLETLCRGIFIRNVKDAVPQEPEMIIKQYADLHIRNKEDIFVNLIQDLIKMAGPMKFGQKWGNRVLYIGSKVMESSNKGFIFVQFYSEVGVLAVFK